MRLREGTSDARVWRHVYGHNEYGLLDAEDKTVVDVGANIGAFTCLAADRGASRVIAIEPFAPNFEILQANAGAYDTVSLVQRAFAEESSQTVTMPNVTEHIEARRAVRGVHGVNFAIVQAAGTGSDSVQTISLRDVLAEYELDRVNLLKIDCEGAEWAVFAALDAETYARIGEICGEYHLYPDYMQVVAGEPTAWLRSRLEREGFAVELEPHPTDPLLGMFYARRGGIERPACCFTARASKHAEARLAGEASDSTGDLSPTERLSEAVMTLRSSRDALKVHADRQKAEIAELERYVGVLKGVRARLRDKVEARSQRLLEVRAEQKKARTRELNPFDGAWREQLKRELQPRRIELSRKLRKLRRDPAKFFEDSKVPQIVRLRGMLRRGQA